MSAQSPAPGLDLDEMVAAATAATGLSDFGGTDLLDALRVLVPALNAEADLRPAGIAGRRGGMVRAMSNRLRLQDALNRHPEIASEPIRSPIVIIGLPRSGTTKLHRMIAADPGMQSLPLWKILSPVPQGPLAAGERDPRIAIGETFERMLRENSPDLYAAHPMAATEPDEDVFALETTGRVYINCSSVRAPTFKAWLDRQPFEGVYRWLQRFLQIVQFYDRGRGKPWVLKAPQHMGFLPELFETFPDATIVHCHRPPEVTVASYVAMITAARRGVSFTADPVDVGQYALEFWSEMTRRYLRDRPYLEKKHRFVDLGYREIVSDGIGTISRIYEAAGIPLSAESRDAMLGWETGNVQHKHGRHSYDLADAKLTEADIADRFGGYSDRFGKYF